MANGPSFAGSLNRTANSAPFGSEPGPGDHVTSCGVKTLCASVAPAGGALAARTAAKARVETTYFIANLPASCWGDAFYTSAARRHRHAAHRLRFGRDGEGMAGAAAESLPPRRRGSTPELFPAAW